LKSSPKTKRSENCKPVVSHPSRVSRPYYPFLREPTYLPRIQSGGLGLGYICEMTSKVTRQHRSVEASERICAGSREAQALSYLRDPDPHE
jgi:hypothetical protein